MGTADSISSTYNSQVNFLLVCLLNHSFLRLLVQTVGKPKKKCGIFRKKKKEATDSSSLNYSAGVLVATFHKAQTVRTDQVLDSKLSGISF